MLVEMKYIVHEEACTKLAVSEHPELKLERQRDTHFTCRMTNEVVDAFAVNAALKALECLHAHVHKTLTS